MKKQILDEHLAAWHKWKSVNVAFDLEELHFKKSKKIFVIDYGAITYHFGNGNPYKKDRCTTTMWKTCCLLLKPTCLFLL
jgi:hypothetical protein